MRPDLQDQHNFLLTKTSPEFGMICIGMFIRVAGHILYKRKKKKKGQLEKS